MGDKAKKKQDREVSRRCSAAYLQRHKDMGQVRCCVWVPDHDEARAALREFGKSLCNGTARETE